MIRKEDGLLDEREEGVCLSCEPLVILAHGRRTWREKKLPWSLLSVVQSPTR